MYAFFDEVKKGRWHAGKILVSWDVCVYEVSQAVAVASFFLSLKDPGHDPWVWWHFSSPVVGLFCGCGAGFKNSGGLGFRCVICLQIMMKIKVINSIKTEEP